MLLEYSNKCIIRKMNHGHENEYLEICSLIETVAICNTLIYAKQKQHGNTQFWY